MPGPREPARAAADESFPKARRLRRRGEFKVVQSRGRRVVTASFVFMVRGNPGLGRRIGVTITKKTLPRAVDRNRVKRVVREVFRRNRAWFPEDADVVVVARRRALGLGYEAARAEVAEVRGPLARAARHTRAPDGEGPAAPRGAG